MPKTKQIILLVDDDELLRDMYGTKFEAEGYEVMVAINGQEALRILREGVVPDAIVFDLIMGVMSGEKFMATAKEEGLAQGSARIALSNNADAEAEKKELGVDGFILKSGSVPSSVVEEVAEIIKKVQKKRGDTIEKEREERRHQHATVVVRDEFSFSNRKKAGEQDEASSEAEEDNDHAKDKEDDTTDKEKDEDDEKKEKNKKKK